MKNFFLVYLLLLFSLLPFSIIPAENELATLRDKTKLSDQKTPNFIPKVTNNNIKKTRSFPMQPPVIPHSIRSYEINRNNNKCLTCHARLRTEESQAPMISFTHFVDRDGNVLDGISPRRYFCNQCHVIQVDTKPLVKNDFIDMRSVVKRSSTSTEYN